MISIYNSYQPFGYHYRLVHYLNRWITSLSSLSNEWCPRAMHKLRVRWMWLNSSSKTLEVIEDADIYHRYHNHYRHYQHYHNLYHHHKYHHHHNLYHHEYHHHHHTIHDHTTVIIIITTISVIITSLPSSSSSSSSIPPSHLHHHKHRYHHHHHHHHKRWSGSISCSVIWCNRWPRGADGHWT